MATSCPLDQAADDETPCDDGDPRTEGNECSAGECLARPPAPNGTPCDDDDLCTQLDFCKAGLCEGKKPKKCKKGLECVPETGMCSP